MSSSDLIKTGIPLMDDAIGGGLKQGSATVYWSEVEVESSALGFQTLYNRLNQGDAGVVVLTTKKSSQVLEAMHDMGFNLEGLPLVFVDAFSAIYGGKSGDRFFVKSPDDADELVSVVKEAILTHKGKHTLLMFDSLSAYVDRFEQVSQVVDIASKFLQLLKEYNVTGIFVFTEWPYEPDLLDKLNQAFDMVVRLEATTQKTVYAIKISKPTVKSITVLFNVLKNSGVQISLPKILVTGPFHAGKTSFIHSASHGAVSVDKLGTTVALDYARVNHKGFSIDLFGTPGQTRFDPLMGKLGGQALGLIIVVSATDRAGLSRVRELIPLTGSGDLPYVIAVNKVNLRGALSVPAMRSMMKGFKKAPFIPMRAKNLAEVRPGHPCELKQEDVEKVLDTIIGQIVKAERRKTR